MERSSCDTRPPSAFDIQKQSGNQNEASRTQNEAGVRGPTTRLKDSRNEAGAPWTDREAQGPKTRLSQSLSSWQAPDVGRTGADSPLDLSIVRPEAAFS
ncbi:hypothetical protein BaRGS_00015845 [Batillaria attramentaria]|uniref:Uncharacterized protein n=1 Tax=Batillaria attramentaria TaxID=370345 RepID=A0ABD0L0T7_9CAEN